MTFVASKAIRPEEWKQIFYVILRFFRTSSAMYFTDNPMRKITLLLVLSPVLPLQI